MENDFPLPDEGVGPIAVQPNKASEGELGSLHNLISTYLTLKIATGKVTSAELGVAVTFLKNNDITCSPAQNEAIENLRRSLSEKRKPGGGLTARAGREAAAAFGEFAGMALPGIQ